MSHISQAIFHTGPSKKQRTSNSQGTGGGGDTSEMAALTVKQFFTHSAEGTIRRGTYKVRGK